MRKSLGLAFAVLLFVTGCSGSSSGGSAGSASTQSNISVPGYVLVAAASQLGVSLSDIKSLTGRKKWDNPDGTEVWEVTAVFVMGPGTVKQSFAVSASK